MLKYIFFIMFISAPVAALEVVQQKPHILFWQDDENLKDLFSSKNKSELCGPTTVANILSYQKMARKSPYLGLNLQSSSHYQVRDFFNLCGTDRNTGTKITQMAKCLKTFYSQSGYSSPFVQVIGPDMSSHLEPDRTELIRNVEIEDIRQALKKDIGVILEVGFYQFNEMLRTWMRKGGHYLWVAGYEYSPKDADEKIHLKVINPQTDYSQRPIESRFDRWEMSKLTKKPDVIYPTGAKYIISSDLGVERQTQAFVRYLILANPESP